MSARALAWALALPATLLVALFLGLPVLATFATTLEGGGGPFARYAEFLGSGFRMAVLWRTLRIAAITTLLAVAIGFPTAWMVSRVRGRLRSVLIVLAVFPLLTGVVVRSFAWLVILGKNGILNGALLRLGLVDEPLAMLYTEGAVIAAMVYLFVPLMVLTLVGTLEGIPSDLVDAATSLGASPGSAFRQIVLPMAVPGLIIGAVLVFTGAFTSYATPQLLGGERQMTMGTFLYQRAMVTFDWVGASTIAAVMTVVTLAVVLAMSRAAARLNPTLA